ncbi:hypothetical protein D9613_010639 [Agrocybe pediades]|uniref:Aminoglycoside phosphotransferase domain-containing protein n=1 Tax=Agrocybe pediades TaxID=84607 RepID=A0A8H4QGJ6_9AGAR|nr:hypothetical protein D9613_010639 [Agrocybe pediades]
MSSLSLSEEQAQKIVNGHLPGHSESTVQYVKEIKNDGYSYTPHTRTYMIDLSPNNSSTAPCSCFIVIAHPNPTNSPEYASHTLPLLSTIIHQILSRTDIPIAKPILDTSLSTVPFPFLLSPASPISSSTILPLSAARKAGLLSPEAQIRVDLQIGRLLGQLHGNVQNDWFGVPLLGSPDAPSDDAGYSWQETFTGLLESLLSEFEGKGRKDLPYQEIRGYLSRAIGSFLFDDADTPSLIWFTGSEDDIYISTESKSSSNGIAAILPNVGHALWGDPLLESFFLPPNPSAAFQEGYLASGGKQTIVFPRQKTKRLWYSLFLGLVVLRERSGSDGTSSTNESAALELIKQSVRALSSAPNY